MAATVILVFLSVLVNVATAARLHQLHVQLYAKSFLSLIDRFVIVCCSLGLSAESAPLTVKLFANGVNLSFENCEDLKPTQEFQLTPADLAPDSMTKLYTVKFQRVSSLSVGVPLSNIFLLISYNWKKAERKREEKLGGNNSFH